MNNLEQYRSISDKYQSLFTILVHDVHMDEIICNLSAQLNKTQAIKSSFKRKYINDRIFNLICYLKEQEVPKNGKINSIYLVGKTIECIELINKQIKILKEYSIRNYLFIFDDYFHIDYLIDLFTNFVFYDVILVNNKSAEHCVLNKNKKKIKRKFKCTKELDIKLYISKNIKNKCLIHGKNFIKKNSLLLHNNYVIYRKLNDEEVFDIFMKEEMKEKHVDLQKCFDMMTNQKELHLVIYGKLNNEIKEAVESYRLKKLFIHTNVIKELQQMVPTECFNFELVIINSLENNDIGQTLMDQYNGAIGVAYY